MSVMSAETEYVATLASPSDIAGWKSLVRRLTAARVDPCRVTWREGGVETPRSLFAKFTADASNLPVPQTTFSVNRAYLALIDRALLHSAPQRFAAAHRLFVRLQKSPRIIDDPTDDDVLQLSMWAKAVRRDMHKMKAFVRFRRVAASGEKESFAAWFEPDHHIVEATAPFFVRRFANMDFTIVTPRVTALFKDGALTFKPGGVKCDAPSHDDCESAWSAYYRNIFNPARIKLKAMQKEMPKKYWRNMPETGEIQSMLRAAPSRIEAMNAAMKRPQAFAEAPPRAFYRSLDAMNEDISACRRCGLCENATQPVFGEGPANARLMFVGEQPGDEEDKAGKPFIGPAGRVLDSALADAGIDRKSAYVTNAVKHFKFEQRGKRRLHQRPNAGEIDHCRWWLDFERALLKPQVIVALGASALRAVTGKSAPVASMRGDVHALGLNSLLVATIHPSYLLRLPDAKQAAIERKQFVRDLEKAAELIRGATLDAQSEASNRC